VAAALHLACRDQPAASVWCSVSVAAFRCVYARGLGVAAMIRGYAASGWLRGVGVSARLVAADGEAATVGWPAEETGVAGAGVDPPATPSGRSSPGMGLLSVIARRGASLPSSVHRTELGDEAETRQCDQRLCAHLVQGHSVDQCGAVGGRLRSSRWGRI
jgi:hypothetical protein